MVAAATGVLRGCRWPRMETERSYDLGGAPEERIPCPGGEVCAGLGHPPAGEEGLRFPKPWLLPCGVFEEGR